MTTPPGLTCVHCSRGLRCGIARRTPEGYTHLSNCRPMVRQGLVWRWLGQRPPDTDDEQHMADLRAAWAAYNRGERDPFVVAGAREYSALTRRQARARKAQQQSGIGATSTPAPSATCETMGAELKTAPAARQRCESGASPTLGVDC